MLSYPRNMSRYWLMFKIPKRNAPLLGLPLAEGRWLRNSLMKLPRTFRDENSRVLAAFRRLFYLYDTTRKETPERTLLLRTTIQSLFIALIEGTVQKPKSVESGRIAAVLDEIRRHPERTYEIDCLAEKTALSRTGLLQLFKRLTGMPPHSFVLACRVEKARQELEQGTERIATIARRWGFPSSQHFARVFKQITGVTPTELRGKMSFNKSNQGGTE